MHFDELLAGVDQHSLVIPGSWGQGRATFGGLVAALAYRKMQGVVQANRPLRALQVAFVGPVTVDEPMAVEVELLREGRAASQVEARIRQGGEIRLVALGSFGGERESQVQVAPYAAPEVPSPEACRALDHIKGVTPEFTQHIEMRWAFGNLPFAGKPDREMGGWMRFREPGSEMTDAHVIALVDAWPPAVLQHVKQPVPASSMSWSLEIVHPRPEMKANEPLLYRAEIDQAGSGYGHTHATVWNRHGELLALSRQTVTVFG